jgi:hypothetical protein
MHYQQGGRKLPNSQGEFCIKGRKIYAFAQGELCIHAFRSTLFTWNLVVLFWRWCRALLPHLEVSAILEHFISVMSSHFPCLRGLRFLSLKWSCLGFWSLVWVFESFLFFFSFLWIGYLCVLSMHSSRGRLRTGTSEDRWMVSPGYDEWLKTWCGLTLGRVLQVQVVASFALVQVKSGRERSMLCWASEELRDKQARLEGPDGQRGQVQTAWWQEKQDEVVDRSRCRVAAHDRSLHTGFAAVHHKTVGLLGWATKSRPEARQAETDPGAPRSFDVGGHVVERRACVVRIRIAATAWPCDEKECYMNYLPLRGLYHNLSARGTLVICPT